ncbi:acyltransferase [Aeromonas caviae]|uniref:acyltransferase n=1 Tax=Aeromonas caviae TaxID=648 RepID=UPI00244B3D8E|nr:acyltransferase [Aeromonas caviae]MDH1994808.1 acyltransferase [Aeromonas caviae]
MSGRDLFKIIKVVINFFVFIVRPFPKCIKKFLYEICSIIPTNIGVFLRYIILKSQAASVGDNVYIARYVIIKNPEKLIIGSNVSIHEFCYIDAEGGITIGDDVSIAHNSSFISFEHTWEDLNTTIKYNKLTLDKIFIGSDVWIGCGVRILAGVKVSNRSVVGAGSVLNKQYPSNVVIVGTPGRVIKEI